MNSISYATSCLGLEEEEEEEEEEGEEEEEERRRRMHQKQPISCPKYGLLYF